MIITGPNGYRITDHEKGCAIRNMQFRTCDCNVVFPFSNLGNWDGWMVATPEQQAAKIRDYKDATLALRYGNR
jgi:hypothetical protein